MPIQYTLSLTVTVDPGRYDQTPDIKPEALTTIEVESIHFPQAHLHLKPAHLCPAGRQGGTWSLSRPLQPWGLDRDRERDGLQVGGEEGRSGRR